MKATVFVDGHGDPQQIPDLSKIKARHAGAVFDIDIVPEYTLKLTLWALQSIMANSRCHASRQTARSTLEEIAATGEFEVDSRGLPASVRFPGKAETRQNLWLVG